MTRHTEAGKPHMEQKPTFQRNLDKWNKGTDFSLKQMSTKTTQTYSNTFRLFHPTHLKCEFSIATTRTFTNDVSSQQSSREANHILFIFLFLDYLKVLLIAYII
jgi:hypothetical protein